MAASTSALKRTSGNYNEARGIHSAYTNVQLKSSQSRDIEAFTSRGLVVGLVADHASQAEAQ